MFTDLLDGLGDLVFPNNCILCSRYVPDKSLPQLCSPCLSAIEFNRPPFCLCCSRHLEVFTIEGLCPTCLKYPIAFDTAWGAVVYNDHLQRLMHLFKYHQQTCVRKVFKHLILEFLKSYPLPLGTFDELMPVPLHPARQRERGFNQANMVADIISEHTGIPVGRGGLTRVRATESQSALGAKERWTNMEGAFRMKKNFNINSKKFLLIDDLLTTGATASYAARALKDAGASRVGLFVVALTPPSYSGARTADQL